MHKVLLTGASGFLVRHCLDLLAADHEVHAVTRSADLPARPNLHTHQVDLFQADHVAALLRDVRPSHLLHLAWITAPATYRDSPENLDWLAASLHLVRAFADNGGQRVVGAGSCAEYDWQHGICDEATTPLRPANLYGVCKNALREVMEQYGRQAGFGTAWGRLFFLYGPGEHPDRFVSYVIRALLADQPAQCSAGSQRRDYIFVKDAAQALCAMLESPSCGAFNIGTGNAISIKELAQTIAALLDKSTLIQIGRKPSPATEPPLLVAHQGRATNELHWAPCYTIESGLTATIEWWRSRATP